MFCHIKGAQLLSTVLAQDHFYSDFLSLYQTQQSYTAAVMMLILAMTLWNSASVNRRLDEL